LLTSTEPLTSRYDCAMLDLDGVVYRGAQAIEGVPDVLGRARESGIVLAFVTNNAARPPEVVAAHLRDLGVHALDTDVVTSAQAAARELADRVPAGSSVLVVGGVGLEAALRERGLVPVSSRADRPVAVVQGFSPDVGWRQLAEGAYVVSGGTPWVASNIDLTVPTADGIAPGNGTLVNAIAAAVGHGPDAVAGKPYRPLFDETLRRVHSRHPLVVGDRLDTDIEGANRCGADSLLVMTGVTDVGALCRASREQRPSYLSWTLEGLLESHAAPQQVDDTWQLGGWTAVAEDDRVRVAATGDDRDEGLRCVVAAAWGWYDNQKRAEPGGTEELDLAAVDDALRMP
jgi:HAD superfamily hydrolase (TIGR01450 family)